MPDPSDRSIRAPAPPTAAASSTAAGPSAEAAATARLPARQPRFGVSLAADGTVFRLWAPAATGVELLLAGPPQAPGMSPGAEVAIPMTADAGAPGWYRHREPGRRVGARYRYRIDGDLIVPDPASAFNPDDVHGPSEVVDHRAFVWRAGDWRGRPWHELVIEEIHVGTFTRQGSFVAAIDRLDALAAAGINAIELLPVADFPGGFNWGYDGVLPFAPDARYGSPDDLRRLVDAAHQRGIAVFLDVVYNHFGPDGNYLGSYAPAFFTDRHRTPWGDAIDFEREAAAAVRAFFVQNAVHWVEHYRVDGLRLDAVHAIHDASDPHIVAEIAAALRAAARPAGSQPPHLVLENEDNIARLLVRDETGSPAIAVAQWNDDVHHALHVLLTGERAGYYRHYADDPARLLAEGLAHGFIDRGQRPGRDGRPPRGEPTDGLPVTAFVNFLQNHDQIGNRARGERIDVLAPPAAVRAARACILLGPAVPMLFMGEEWGSQAPFCYFTDAKGDLACAIRAGRGREFGDLVAARGAEAIPDPCSDATFEASRLDGAGADPSSSAREHLAWVHAALAVRRDVVVPLLATEAARLGRQHASITMLSPRALRVRWQFGDRGLALLVSFEAAATVTSRDDPDLAIAFAVGDAGGAGAGSRRAGRGGRGRGVRLGPYGVVLLA